MLVVLALLIAQICQVTLIKSSVLDLNNHYSSKHFSQQTQIFLSFQFIQSIQFSFFNLKALIVRVFIIKLTFQSFNSHMLYYSLATHNQTLYLTFYINT